MLLAPGEEFRNRAAIGEARVRVADVGDEEFPKAGLRAVAGGGGEGGGSASGEGDVLPTIIEGHIGRQDTKAIKVRRPWRLTKCMTSWRIF